MKKIFLVFALLFVGFMNAQVMGGDMFNYEPKSEAEMNAITVGQGLQDGSVIYRTDTKSFWRYNGTTWNEVSGSGASDWASITGKPALLDEDSTDDVTLTGNQTIQKQLTMGGGSLIIKNSAGGTNYVTVTMPNEDQLSLNPSAGNALGFNFLTGRWTVGVDNIIDDSYLVDDDTFATATASNVPSAESVKAYVDAGGNFGIVASGNVEVGEENAGVIHTVSHNLGYVPDAGRITLGFSDVSSSTAIGLGLKITAITTTDLSFTTGSTIGSGNTLFVNWKVFGTGNVSAVIEGHNIEDDGSGVTKRGNLNFTGAVTVTDDAGNDRTTIDITGGSAQTLSISGSESDQLSISGGNTVDLSEGIQDNVGNMVGGNTENRINVTYDDVAGKLNFDVTDQDAIDTPYDNNASGLVATNVKAAIDELVANGNTDDQTASEVSYDNSTSGLAATDTKAAIDEVVDEGISIHPSSPNNIDNIYIGTEAEIAGAGLGSNTLAFPTDGKQEKEIIVALSDLETDITTGTGKGYFYMPYAATLTGAKVTLDNPGTSTGITVDMNEDGTSVLSVKLTTDATETTSSTASTPVVISDSSLADNAKITFDFDAVPTGGKGVQVTLYLEK